MLLKAPALFTLLECESSDLSFLFDLGSQHHWSWTRDPAIFAYSPEMNDHKCGSDDGDRDTVPNIGSQQRIGIYDGSPQ
jgi:hypothetical protein